MLVSVVIPVHNAELYLERSLNSVLGQTYKNIEVIIVNDASSDNSQAIIEKYEKLDSRIKVICHKTNLGAFFARKTGMESAKGKFYIDCDADDELLSGFIEKGVSILRNQVVDILDFGRMKLDGKNVSRAHKKMLNIYHFSNNHLIQGRDIFDFFFLKEKIKITTCGKFFRTEFARQYFPLTCPNSGVDDLFILIYLTYYAQSYRYVRDCGYIYHCGCGHWGRTDHTEEQMLRMAQTCLLFRQLESFFEKEQMASRYFEKLELKRKEVFKNILCMAQQECSLDLFQKFVHILQFVWGEACFTEILYELMMNKEKELNSIPYRLTYPLRALHDFIFLKIFKQNSASLKDLFAKQDK